MSKEFYPYITLETQEYMDVEVVKIIDRRDDPQWLDKNYATRLMERLDAVLHPWGAPGVVPTKPGTYWVETGGAGVCRAELLEDAAFLDCQAIRPHETQPAWAWDFQALAQAWSTARVLAAATDGGWRFRKCWTPSAPEVKRGKAMSGLMSGPIHRVLFRWPITGVTPYGRRVVGVMGVIRWCDPQREEFQPLGRNGVLTASMLVMTDELRDALRDAGVTLYTPAAPEETP